MREFLARQPVFEGKSKYFGRRPLQFLASEILERIWTYDLQSLKNHCGQARTLAWLALGRTLFSPRRRLEQTHGLAAANAPPIARRRR
jgi:hypothetical protein